MKISVVGLGTAKDEVTLRGLDEIMSADVVALKTAMTDTADTLRERNIDFVSCDSLFDEARDFSVLTPGSGPEPARGPRPCRRYGRYRSGN